MTREFLAIGWGSALILGCGSSSPAAALPTDGGGVEASGVEGGGADALAIPNLTPQAWTWVAFPDAHCRDGSSTGVGINVNPSSTKLMIFLEGGGACFNALTCAANPACFPESGSCATGTFSSWKASSTSSAGIFNRSDPANPVKDWNMVYVPFCTGDVHSGNNPNGQVPGVMGTQEFVGHANVARYLARLVPTFGGVTQVLLTGVSAGGFGAAANYPQVAKAFAPVPVYELDDSGPPMADPFAAKCLQDQVRQLWNLDQTLLADCGADCPDRTNYQLDLTTHVVKRYPSIPFGLIEDTNDSVITVFYGFGQNGCSGLTPLSKQQFTDGINDIRTKLMADGNFGAFIFDDTAHTTLSSAAYDTRTAGGVLMTDWVRQLVERGMVTNVGPP